MHKMCPIPQPIEVMVQKQNLEFHHTKSHFSYPYFQFMKQLLLLNYSYIRVQVEQGSLSPTVVSQLTMYHQGPTAARYALGIIPYSI